MLGKTCRRETFRGAKLYRSAYRRSTRPSANDQQIDRVETHGPNATKRDRRIFTAHATFSTRPVALLCNRHAGRATPAKVKISAKTESRLTSKFQNCEFAANGRAGRDIPSRSTFRVGSDREHFRAASYQQRHYASEPSGISRGTGGRRACSPIATGGYSRRREPDEFTGFPKFCLLTLSLALSGCTTCADSWVQTNRRDSFRI